MQGPQIISGLTPWPGTQHTAASDTSENAAVLPSTREEVKGAGEVADSSNPNEEEPEMVGFGSITCTPDTIIVSPGSPSVSGTALSSQQFDSIPPVNKGAVLSAEDSPCTANNGPRPSMKCALEAAAASAARDTGAAFIDDKPRTQPCTTSSAQAQEASLNCLAGRQQAHTSATASPPVQGIPATLSRMPFASTSSTPEAGSTPPSQLAPTNGHSLSGMPPAAAGSTPTLETEGREDILPTPHLTGLRSQGTTLQSPSTPQDLPFKPYAFSLSAGSHMATPEVPISTCMTPMTASETRQAQKHIPAWNRVSRVVEKQAPLTFRQIKNLWATPTGQQPCAKTPFLLLQSVCSLKGWELTVRHESEVRIGSATSVVATVNVPDVSGGRAFSAVGKSAGMLHLHPVSRQALALLVCGDGILAQRRPHVSGILQE
jgi:hypothetical protein